MTVELKSVVISCVIPVIKSDRWNDRKSSKSVRVNGVFMTLEVTCLANQPAGKPFVDEAMRVVVRGVLGPDGQIYKAKDDALGDQKGFFLPVIADEKIFLLMCVEHVFGARPMSEASMWDSFSGNMTFGFMGGGCRYAELRGVDPSLQLWAWLDTVGSNGRVGDPEVWALALLKPNLLATGTFRQMTASAATQFVPPEALTPGDGRCWERFGKSAMWLDTAAQYDPTMALNMMGAMYDTYGPTSTFSSVQEFVTAKTHDESVASNLPKANSFLDFCKVIAAHAGYIKPTVAAPVTDDAALVAMAQLTTPDPQRRAQGPREAAAVPAAVPQPAERAGEVSPQARYQQDYASVYGMMPHTMPKDWELTGAQNALTERLALQTRVTGVDDTVVFWAESFYYQLSTSPVGAAPGAYLEGVYTGFLATRVPRLQQQMIALGSTFFQLIYAADAKMSKADFVRGIRELSTELDASFIHDTVYTY